MSSPILSTNVAQRIPYCTSADVNNLIGNVITNASFSGSAVTSYIAEAVQYIDRETNAFFSPRRIVQRYDGNGSSRMNLAHSHVMAINEVSVFFTYPLTLSRIAHEWDLLVDRPGGTISFPTYTASPVFAPYAFTFFSAAQNVEVDAWFGWTRQVFGEQLTTTDHTTYALANPTAIRQTLQIAYPYQFDQPPTFVPVVKKNGVIISNTEYVLTADELVTANSEWQIAEDNLVYTVNTSANGITGFTFNQANTSEDVITCDYVYWYIPEDVQIATAKRAAINILSAVSSGVFNDNQFNGMDTIQMDGGRLQSANGQFGALITRWQADIADTVARYRAVPMDFTGGYIPDGNGGIWF